jgi:uncharacterized membrane protein YcfT
MTMTTAPADRYRPLHWIVVALASVALLLNVYAATRRPDVNVRPSSWLMPVGILFLGIGGLVGRRWPWLRMALVMASLLLVVGGLLSTLRG